MKYATLDDQDVSNKRIFLRCDFNVPLSDGIIVDDTRIIASLETIKELLDKGAKLLLASHLGRPKSDEDRAKLSLKPVAKRLSEVLGHDVHLAPDCSGDVVKEFLSMHSEDALILLENVRFAPGETKNDEALAQEWATYCDAYVNDAFGSSHREHTSVCAITRHVPSAMGRLVEKELSAMLPVLEEPKRPFVLIVGGSKLSSKLPLLEKMVSISDHILVGGAMMFTFLKAEGKEVGRSLVENDFVDAAKQLLDSGKIHLPRDTIITKSIDDHHTQTVNVDDIPTDSLGVDIGSESVEAFATVLATAQTILWNGPMGIFEVEEFAQGTKGIAQILAKSEATTIIGGGDSVAAVKACGVEEQMTHISTGGGATLELLEKGSLPGLKCLEKQ